MSKVAITYGRFSTVEQTRGYSLERQKCKAIEFASSLGWTVERSIFDEGKSAFHGRNRDEGSALHGFEVEARGGMHVGKVLVVENIDRLSRQGAKAAARLIWDLNESGVDVATYHDGHIYSADKSDMLEIFSVIIAAQVAHDESRKKSKHTKATWEKRFKAIADGSQLAPIPNIPPWVDFKDGVYSLNDSRSQVLNEIYDWYISGEGIHRIATKLNARGEPQWTTYKSRQSNGWFYSYIYRLLTKRAVMGEYITSAGDLISTTFYPQAIPAEKFNQVQSILALRKSNRKASENKLHRNLLTRLVYCAECGGGAHFLRPSESTQSYRKVSGEVVTYQRKGKPKLRCDRARRKHNCNNDTILNYEIIETTVLDGMLPILARAEISADQVSSLRDQLAELQRQLSANEHRLANIIDAIAEGQGRALMAKMNELEAMIEEQNLTANNLKTAIAIQSSKPPIDQDIDMIRRLKSDLSSDDPDVRIPTRGRINIALRRLIKRIEIEVQEFRIWTSDDEWYLFDEEGTMLESQLTVRKDILLDEAQRDYIFYVR